MGSVSELDANKDEKKSNAEMKAEWPIDVNQDPYAMPLEAMNPAHNDLFEAGTMMPWFERLRAEAPVHYCANSQFGPYWSVTTYDDIQYIDSHHELFSSDIVNGGIRLGGQVMEQEPDPLTHLPMFIMQDPPVHDEQRKVLAPKFTGPNLAEFGDLIRGRAGKILDDLPRGETFNWVRKVSVELTGMMLSTLFDIPLEDRHKLIHWSDTIERIGDPDFFETPEEAFQELWKCFEYFDVVWKERAARETPGTDLISMLVHGEATQNMSPQEYLGNILLLIVGGNDTTRNSISGGVLAMHEHPEEFAKLKADQSLIPNMVSEVIRWQSPVAHMARTAMQDIELGGQLIKKYDRVVMWYLSGNRDTTKIPDADKFLIDRAGARRHLSFGFGIHRCMGNRLGEMQLQILWEEILKRFGRIEVVGEPKFLKSSFIRGITDLPVRLHEK